MYLRNVEFKNEFLMPVRLTKHSLDIFANISALHIQRRLGVCDSANVTAIQLNYLVSFRLILILVQFLSHEKSSSSSNGDFLKQSLKIGYPKRRKKCSMLDALDLDFSDWLFSAREKFTGVQTSERSHYIDDTLSRPSGRESAPCQIYRGKIGKTKWGMSGEKP